MLYKKKETDFDKILLINRSYIEKLNLLIKLIINDKKYIEGLISYLEDVKIKCPSKYVSYKVVMFNTYFFTNFIFSKRRFDKAVPADLLNINFHKLTNIIIKKLNISKQEKDSAMINI